MPMALQALSMVILNLEMVQFQTANYLPIALTELRQWINAFGYES